VHATVASAHGGGEVNRAARSGAVIGAGAAGGLALASLVLPQLVSTVGPTALAAALLAVLLALLTAATQRWVTIYRARSAVQDALREWPPPLLGRAHLDLLGVYPPPAGSDGYVPRPHDEDAALRAALENPGHIVVHGPPGCGKSRAAAEAARHVLGSIRTIVPVDSDAIASLADGTVTVEGAGTDACLWLDGLDRFMDKLDPGAIRAFDTATKPRIRIVATIRSDQWSEMVHGCGPQTEAARALGGRAKIVELQPRELPPGTTASPPAAEPSEPPEPRPPRRLWLDPAFAALGAAAAATAAALAIAGVAGGLVKPPAIGDQISALTQQALAREGPGGAHVVVSERVQFHDTDDPSWVLVVEDRPTHLDFYDAVANGLGGPPPRSDIVRVYDVVDDRLTLRLSYRPQGTAKDAAAWEPLQTNPGVAPVLDNGGVPQLLAGYALPDANSAELPLGLEWKDGAYRLLALTPHPPDLDRAAAGSAAATFRRELYEHRFDWPNAVHGGFGRLRLTGYLTQALAFAQEPQPRVLMAYYLTHPVYAQPSDLELHVTQLLVGSLQVQPCTPGNGFCPAPVTAPRLTVPANWSLAHALLVAWGTDVTQRFVPPIQVK
jgi:hypothetical protein